MRTWLSSILVIALQYMGIGAPAAETQSCSAMFDVTDQDPKGTNVRAAPGGAVIAALKNPGEGWIAVHLTGQTGDWFRIDRAVLIDAGGSTDGHVIFRGAGWLHRSVLGVSGMQSGGVIYKDHDGRDPKLKAHASGNENVVLLGCWGAFLKVRAKKGVGWTKAACTNMITTCV